jgi:hypothetical protein
VLNFKSVIGLVGHHVDNPGHGVRSVERRCAVGYYVHLLNGYSGHQPLNIAIGGSFAVNQLKGCASSKAAQIKRG